MNIQEVEKRPYQVCVDIQGNWDYVARMFEELADQIRRGPESLYGSHAVCMQRRKLSVEEGLQEPLFKVHMATGGIVGESAAA